LHYYAPVYVSGPSTVCSSGATFTINNLPQVDSIICEHGLYLAITSGQYDSICNFSATGAGTTWVRARLVTTCGSITLPAKTVHAGTPSPTQIAGFEYDGKEFAGNTLYQFRVSYPGANDYEWNVGGGSIISGQGTDQITVRTVEVTGSNNVYFDVGIRVKTWYCGWSGYFIRTGWVVPGTGGITMLFTPNPTTGETTLTIETTSEEKTFDETAQWDLEVYSETQLLKTKQTGLRGQSARIQTAGWKEGVYIVRVNYNGEVLTGKLLVKR
jgi:hypothetical protein